MPLTWWPVISLNGSYPRVEASLTALDHPEQDGNKRKLPLGGSALRSDSLGKVTGRTEYAEDMQVPGLLHLKVVRSPYHHARLHGIAVARAACLPGVKRIL